MKEQIIRLLKENIEDLKNVDIDSNTKLIDEGYVDSFDVINLLSVLEDKFNISIPIDNLKLESFNSIDYISDLVTNLSSKAD